MTFIIPQEIDFMSIYSHFILPMHQSLNKTNCGGKLKEIFLDWLRVNLSDQSPVDLSYVCLRKRVAILGDVILLTASFPLHDRGAAMCLGTLIRKGEFPGSGIYRMKSLLYLNSIVQLIYAPGASSQGRT